MAGKISDINKINKNEIYRITVNDLTDDGAGIGKIIETGKPNKSNESNEINKSAGYTIFTDGIIPGDIAEIKIIKSNKNYGYGKLIQIISPSENRIKPQCGVFKNCGGCALQHMEYNAQLAHKRKTVIDCLERIGGIKNADEIVSETLRMENPYNYRNKAQFPVSFNKKTNKIEIGFFTKRTHDIIDIESCDISHKINDKIISIFKDYFAVYSNYSKNKSVLAYDETTHTGLIRHIFTRIGFKTGEIMVCAVINGDGLPDCGKLINDLSRIQGMKSIMLNINKAKTNVILGETNKAVWGADYITDYIGDKKFRISVNSFYQVNPVQTEKLYKKALDFAEASPDYICVDAYCGIGTISLMFAPLVKKVYGIEIVPQAVADAIINAKINNIKNAEFITGKAEEVIFELLEREKKIDILIVDPPRKGCGIELISAISESKINKIVYISCNPATLARDVRILCENGYDLKKAQPVDMFPHTMHVETIVLLQHKRQNQ